MSVRKRSVNRSSGVHLEQHRSGPRGPHAGRGSAGGPCAEAEAPGESSLGVSRICGCSRVRGRVVGRDAGRSREWPVWLARNRWPRRGGDRANSSRASGVTHSYDHADDHASVDGTIMRLLARAAVCGALLISAAAFVTGPATAAPPAPTSTPVSGTVFGDANSNGTSDPGEGLTGFPISFGLESGNGTTTTVTSTARGAFPTSLAPGTHYLSGSGGGWDLMGRSITVTAARLHLDLRAVHPLGKVLTASLHFTRRTYAPGDVVHLVVTVANTGNRLLRGIGAECDHAGNADELLNNKPGWGPTPAGHGRPDPSRALGPHDRRHGPCSIRCAAGGGGLCRLRLWLQRCRHGLPPGRERPSDGAGPEGCAGRGDLEVHHAHPGPRRCPGGPGERADLSNCP